MSGRLTPAQAEFVADMLDENPFASPDRVDGTPRWINVDPPYARATVFAFERRGWIETRGSGREAEHRWTPLGHAERLASLLRDMGYRVSRPVGVADRLRASPTTPTHPVREDGR